MFRFRLFLALMAKRHVAGAGSARDDVAGRADSPTSAPCDGSIEVERAVYGWPILVGSAPGTLLFRPTIRAKSIGGVQSCM